MQFSAMGNGGDDACLFVDSEKSTRHKGFGRNEQWFSDSSFLKNVTSRRGERVDPIVPWPLGSMLGPSFLNNTA